MDKYIKFSVVMEYLRNRSDEARKCGHEETYFDLLTIINGLKNVETIPASALGKDTNVPTKSALDHIHNVVRDDAYRRGYEQGKADAIKWIPIKTRPLTGEEKEEYPEWDCFLDCELQDDGQEILVTYKVGNKKMVSEDTFFNDDCCYLDSGLELGEDVLAWAEKPEPWKGEVDGQTD
jgi:hypothetical protein